MTDPFDEQDRRRPRGRGRRRRSDERDGVLGGDRAPDRAQRAGRAAGDAAGSADEDAPGDPESVARAVCLRALTGAPKTRAQLAELLAKRGIPDDAAETVLDRFTEVGLIDDAAFARAWVTSRQAGRGLARGALRQELRAKGVEGEVAVQALDLVDEDDERETARRLVERRLAGMHRLDRTTATRRLMGMLARKGYGPGLAAGVVREAVAEAGLPATLDVPSDEDEPVD